MTPFQLLGAAMLGACFGALYAVIEDHELQGEFVT